ncbi:MAG: AI-2E family transporter [Anaerolineae bacterium]|nr:AI-2E family transporter [Thermoflexales bacterium]MDW8407723.1 AI-2E family transporter [Anaerolineae bacterium]
MTREKIFRVATILAIIALSIVIIEQVWRFGQTISGLLSVLAGAWFLALVLRPFINSLRRLTPPPVIVRWVERRFGALAAQRIASVRMPFALAVSLVYITALVIVSGLLTIGVATALDQIRAFVNRLPEFSTALPGQIRALWASFALQFDLDPTAIDQILSAEAITTQVRDSIGNIAQQTLSLAAGTANLVAQLALMLILSLFMTMEGRLLQRQIFLLIPREAHEPLIASFAAVDRSFTGYLRGYVFAALIRAAIALLVCSLFQINFSVVISLQYAILSFIPLLGSPLGIGIAAVIALVVRPDAALAVTIILLIADQIVAYIVLPRIMSDIVGVPGLVQLVSVTIGVQLVGFWGLLFSIPVVGAAYALAFDFYLPRMRRAQGLPETDSTLEEVLHRRHNKPSPAQRPSASPKPDGPPVGERVPTEQPQKSAGRV